MLSTEEKDFSGFFGFTMENMNQYLIKSSFNKILKYSEI